MALRPRIAAILRSAARSPEVRQLGRRIARTAVREVQARRSGRSGPSNRGDARRDGSVQDDARRDDPGRDALPDRASMPPVAITYAPAADGDADPGEVVWGWVPFEEDITRGKDRPALVLAREEDADGPVLVALMLTSRDRVDGVRTDEYGSTWVDIGTGSWDSQGRPSEVRADRLLRLRASAVRREGGRLPERVFDRVAAVVREVHGWQ